MPRKLIIQNQMAMISLTFHDYVETSFPLFNSGRGTFITRLSNHA